MMLYKFFYWIPVAFIFSTCESKRDKNYEIKYPSYQYSNNPILEISRIIVHEESLQLYFNAYFAPGCSIMFIEGTSIVANGKSYLPIKTQNIDIDKWKQIPEDGQIEFMMEFPALPEDVKEFDLIEDINDPNCFRIYGISLDSPVEIRNDRLSAFFDEKIIIENKKSMSQDKISILDIEQLNTEIEINLINYDKRFKINECKLLTKWLIKKEKRFEQAGYPDDNGLVRFNFDIKEPVCVLFTADVINCKLILVPGQKNIFWIDVEECSRRSLRKKNKKRYTEDLVYTDNGFNYLINKLNNNQLNIDRAVNNHFSELVYVRSSSEYFDYIEKEVKAVEFDLKKDTILNVNEYDYIKRMLSYNYIYSIVHANELILKNKANAYKMYGIYYGDKNKEIVTTEEIINKLNNITFSENKYYESDVEESLHKFIRKISICENTEFVK